ncbi:MULTISPECIES: adenylate/guanylate cyclase domain-containing protein [unclassified Tolypothrix]|uniref:adenylate/guanylate cyclase domain-containing protein n=1 Tax=unclassified Tolypothrix TaxID=2649714 RepID=UPI0005EAC4DC|nr:MULTISPECIES: adenylate/guanylate cyclase domain-containing protein [unclassified Tolypothrix]BAY88522.1 adenylate cyclase [Microchaete diplosiphon NIES-3275]EKF02630.1 GAF domain protein [Tolypothrix sp. PCC 7601]MBE9084425.1 FHA domain-containing protein [Tolypothrix sp. LEGE 11397]UYD29196.1 FHA domain-containing protein [Tolypothrix sp. PCC 7712]UYD34892.1 FHA domain-containing protein [Tolypothrix sp. PCC 7601]
MPYLIYAPKTPQERVHQLIVGMNTIGRSGDNTIVIGDESLSRYHAEITIADDRITIKDLQSLNHTFVNEVKIDQYELKDGDSIYCGNVEFKFVEKLNSTPTNDGCEEEPIPETIIKQFSTEQGRFNIQDLLDTPGRRDSLLRLSQRGSNQRTVDKLKILLEVSKQLSSPEEPDRLLEKILDLLFEIINVDRAVILLVSETTKQLEQRVAKLRSGTSIENLFYSKNITNHVYQNGNAVVTTDACLDQRFHTSESIFVQAIRASMCIPLKPREEVIGVLYVDNLSMSDVYSDEDVEFLTALANQAAIAIDNANLYKKIQAEAVMRNKLERFFPEPVRKKLKEETTLGIVDTEVTALFADISNFTQMSSTMHPRQVIAMLNEYFEVMVEEIVFQYEGTLEKYIGDALFAIWGAPYRKADDTERAIQAAIDMQWAVMRLNQKWLQQGKQPIQIHIGLNTGKVAAGNIGSEKLIQYATIGDTTNVTSRICNVAQAGEIVISQTTFERIQARNLPVEKMPLVQVKGQDQPLQLYRLNWNLLPSKHSQIAGVANTGVIK